MRILQLLIPVTLLGACSIVEPARMRLPSDLAETSVRQPFAGIGGGTRGRFEVGAYHGSFTRSERRLAVFDVFVKNHGHTSFVMSGPAIGSTIEAACKVSEKRIDLGIAEFETRPMAYRCDFTADGRPFPVRFELQEVRRGLGGALSRRERHGEIALGSETVQIRSIHRLDGSPIEMANPIGYVFEQEGEPVGAVELNGAPVLFLADGRDTGLARTITVAATSLAIFWDPANSALDD
mgnify:CR=1 FL=1